MMKRPELSIVIPTYNEKENIVSLIKKIQKRLSKHTYEIIVVDDNSEDGTGQYLQKKYKSNKKIKCFIRNEKKDLGASILHGIEKAEGKIIVGMDGDGNHDPKLLEKLIFQLSFHDLVIASRFIRGGGMEDKLHYWLSFFANIVFGKIIASPIHDITSGYYAVRQTKLRLLPLNIIYHGYGDYSIRLVYFAKRKGLSMYELSTYYYNRRYGQSKSRLISMLFSYTLTAVKLRLL